MTIDELERKLNDRLALLGGSAAVLDDTCIVLSCSGLQGLIVLMHEGRYFIKVSTLWNDQDEAYEDVSEQIPGKVVELFTGFWRRRGIAFRSALPSKAKPTEPGDAPDRGDF
jgi:hypothetical protein